MRLLELCFFLGLCWASQVALVVKRICLPMQEMQETRARSLSWEDPLEEGMATHFSVLAGKIPRTAEVDRIEATEHSTGLCLRSWTARPAPTHTHTVLIINYQERPTWGKRPVPNPGGEQGTGFQDDLELVFLGPKLSATSYLSRHRNFRTPALPPLPWWNFQSKCHSLGRGRACIVLTLKESRGVTGCRSCI